MSAPLFFTPKSYLNATHKVRPIEECHFNEIELICPKCTIKQLYIDVTLNGQNSIVCDYCTRDIPIRIGSGGECFRRLQSDSRFGKNENQITVVSRR